MTTTIKATSDGLSGELQVNGAPALRYGADTSGQMPGFRNRIINGDMRIDQRNAGAAVTANTGVVVYAVDRTLVENNSGSAVIQAQQVSDAPSGFVNSLKVTVTTADATLNATDRTLIAQNIEGYNVQDLAWGTSSASVVTLSFWAKSSLTGNFGGAILNNALDRAYPFAYSMNSANTWERKTITISGPTTGTWLTNSGKGIGIVFGLGVGATYSGTSGSWASTAYLSSVGAANFTATLNATFQITGVQLEAGSIATPFEHRPYGTELALCQRYYQVVAGAVYSSFADGVGGNKIIVPLQTKMRTNPTVTYSFNNAATSSYTSSTDAVVIYSVSIANTALNTFFATSEL